MPKDQPIRGIENLNTKVSAEFRRLIDWHCDQLGNIRPHRPNLGEFLEERLRPILEKEGKPPVEYRGAKRKGKPEKTTGSKRRSRKSRGPQAIDGSEVA